MFWKKNTEDKQLSPKEILINQLEQLAPGKTLSYKLPELWGGELAIVGLNPQYPQNGKKYFIDLEEFVANKPSGQRKPFVQVEKTKEMASWIIEKEGVPFG